MTITEPWWPVVAQGIIHEGRIFTALWQRVAMPDGELIKREVIQQKPAVSVVAVNDQDEILMLRQYRVPVAQYMWETPAGRVDGEGESAFATIKRELAEEADYEADTWRVLLDMYPSPGTNSEAVRVYYATDLSKISEAFPRADEEKHSSVHWIHAARATMMCLNGEITDGHTVAGIMALRTFDFRPSYLRPSYAPWPAHPELVSYDDQ